MTVIAINRVDALLSEISAGDWGYISVQIADTRSRFAITQHAFPTRANGSNTLTAVARATSGCRKNLLPANTVSSCIRRLLW